jgi:hypothetical protein
MAKAKKTSTEGREKTTLYLNGDLFKKIKLITVIQNKESQTETLHEALSEYIERYEKKNGPLPVQKL